MTQTSIIVLRVNTNTEIFVHHAIETKPIVYSKRFATAADTMHLL